MWASQGAGLAPVPDQTLGQQQPHEDAMQHNNELAVLAAVAAHKAMGSSLAPVTMCRESFAQPLYPQSASGSEGLDALKAAAPLAAALATAARVSPSAIAPLRSCYCTSPQTSSRRRRRRWWAQCLEVPYF